MTTIKQVFVASCLFLATLSFAATPKATAKTKKTPTKQLAKTKLYSKRLPAREVVVDQRVNATRKVLAQTQGYSAGNHLRGSAKLAPMMFPEFTVPQVSTHRSTPSYAQLAGLDKTSDPLSLSSSAAFVVNQATNNVLFQKNAAYPLPMASVTKLMTGLVVVESMQDMGEILEITREDAARAISSRLKIGTKTTRGNLLHLALMSSENRAAACLGRNYPGGFSSFIATMNAKARALGMTHTYYEDTTGLSNNNVATAQDLSKLVIAASQYPILRQFSTDTGYVINDSIQPVHYSNTNRLVHNSSLHIGLQKTGFTSAAGNCLVMQVTIDNAPIVMVFLDAKGKESRISDVLKIRNWVQKTSGRTKPQT